MNEKLRMSWCHTIANSILVILRNSKSHRKKNNSSSRQRTISASSFASISEESESEYSIKQPEYDPKSEEEKVLGAKNEELVNLFTNIYQTRVLELTMNVSIFSVVFLMGLLSALCLLYLKNYDVINVCQKKGLFQPYPSVEQLQLTEEDYLFDAVNREASASTDHECGVENSLGNFFNLNALKFHNSRLI